MEMQRVQFRGMCQVMAKGSDLALELADKSPEVAENTAAASGPSAE
jgi:hypothetical protein